MEGSAAVLLSAIEAAGGFIDVTDKSAPEVIRSRFDMSKKEFKRAVGSLYKARIIAIEADGIRQVEN